MSGPLTDTVTWKGSSGIFVHLEGLVLGAMAPLGHIGAPGPAPAPAKGGAHFSQGQNSADNGLAADLLGTGGGIVRREGRVDG